MPEATPTAEEITTGNIAVPIDIGSGRTATVTVPARTATYFGITGAAATGGQLQDRTRRAHARKIYDELTNTVKDTKGIKAAAWQAPAAAPNPRAGKAVRVPTELLTKGSGTTSRTTVRYTTIHFPGSAVTGAISRWLATKCTKRKPNHFIMPSGRKYPVIAGTGDINPGERDADAGLEAAG